MTTRKHPAATWIRPLLLLALAAAAATSLGARAETYRWIQKPAGQIGHDEPTVVTFSNGASIFIATPNKPGEAQKQLRTLSKPGGVSWSN